LFFLGGQNYEGDFLFRAAARRCNGSCGAGEFSGLFFMGNMFGSYPAMKKIIPLLTLALVFVSAIRGLCAEAATVATSAAPRAQKVIGTVELLDVIKPDAKSLAAGDYKLSREWVGTLVPHEDKLAQSKLSAQQSYPFRFNYLRVMPDGTIWLLSERVDDAGHLGSQGWRFKFMRKLRSPDAILQTREPDTLKSWMGPSWPWGTCATSFGDEVSWSEMWALFDLAQNQTIMCQRIVVFVSCKEKTMDEGTPLEKTILSGSPWLEGMYFSDGIFRPANPDSEEERRMYPSENDKYMARLAKENARIDAQPEPLRSLFKARYTTDNLVTYNAAIERFRAKPDPLLIRQLVERLDGGGDGARASEMLRHLKALMDESENSWLNISPWKPENKKMAIEALIDSLPEAPSFYGESVIALILAETSLVTLKMDEPDFSIEITVISGGISYSHCFKNGADWKTVIPRAADELRRRWEASGFCVERYSAPASEK